MRNMLPAFSLVIYVALISPVAGAEKQMAPSASPQSENTRPAGRTGLNTVTVDGIEYTGPNAPAADVSSADPQPHPSCSNARDCFDQADAALGQPDAPSDVVDHATEQLSFACMNGLDFACRRVEHIFYPDGVFIIHAMDGAKARETGACNQGVARSCLTAAWLSTFEAAIFKRAEPRNIKRLSETDTNFNPASAAIAIVSNDFHQTASLSQKACDDGLKLACALNIENELAGNGPNLRAKELIPDYVNLCSQGVDMACVNLAALQANRALPFLDYTQARATFEIYCSHGSGPACYDLGSLYLNGRDIAPDSVKVLDSDLKGCRLGQGGSCNRAGVSYIIGRGITKDIDQGLILMKQGCGYEDTTACFNLGLAFDQGKVVVRDAGQARKYYQRACELGSTYNCRG